MSIFGTGETNTGNNNSNESNNQQTYLDRVVAAKGENWRDIETLAKGKWESDAYIQQLEDEMKSLREETEKSASIDTLLEALKGKAAGTGNATGETSNNASGTHNGGTNQNVTEDTLKSLIDSTITEREKRATAAQNLQTVETAMAERFGTEAAATVEAKMKELGMSKETLESLASQSPNAFLALMGNQPDKQTGSNFNPASSTTRTESGSFTHNGERDWNYYQKLRRENRSLYMTPEIQRQMFADRQRLGDKFGNN
jgi:hypothetical protein